MRVVYYFDEELSTDDGIVVFRCTAVDLDAPDIPKAVYFPGIELIGRKEVLCTCRHWLWTVEPMLYYNGFYASVASVKQHCTHIKQCIDILIEEGRL